MNKVKNYSIAIFHTLGLNKEILWNTYNQAWTALKGPISIFFILKYLLPEEQGLWYTFLSLGALKIFAELGFTMIVTQFVSHEFALLPKFDENKLDRSNEADRFVSLIKYSISFYFKVIPIAILIMVIVGYFYFSSNSLAVFIAWSAYSFLGGLTLFLSIFQAIYKGINKVKEVQKNLFIGSILMGFGNWLFLYLDFDIWALIIGNFIGVLCMIANLYYIAPRFWMEVKNYKVKNAYSWFNNIMKLQWRYAISWASGYFIFNLIVPVLFKFEGADVAGKYGITFRVIIALIGISQAWVFTKIPSFNILVAQKRRKELNQFFKKSFVQSILIQIFFSIFLLFTFYILFDQGFYEDRFLSIKDIIILLLIQLPIQIVNYLAIYLRSHKEEPYVLYSVFCALMMTIALFLVLPKYGFNYMLYFMLVSYYLILLPYALFVFYQKKKIFFKKYY